MSNETVIYVPATSAKAIRTTHGEMLKIACKAQEVSAFLLEHANADGWVTLLVTKRKQADEKGRTHSVKLDTWKPDPTKGGKAQFANDVAAAGGVDDDSIPF